MSKTGSAPTKSSSPPAKSGGGPSRADVAQQVAVQYAKGGRGGKPSTTRKAVGGAATGAATGAAIGSVVPGVGTAVGAGAGAVIGGAGGAWKGHSDKQAWKRSGRSGSSRALLAEFVLCLVIVALAPVARPKGEVTAGAWMKRGSAVCVMFILLGMLASVGPRTSRVAVAFGGLVTLGLVVSEREVIGTLLAKFGPSRPVGGSLLGDGGGDDPDRRVQPDDPADRIGLRPLPDGPTRS